MAVCEWQDEARRLVYDALDGFSPAPEPGYTALTNLLVAWCDSQSNGIDGTPLQAVHRQIEARRVKQWRGGKYERPRDWRPDEELEREMTRAVAICERIEELARTRETSPAVEPASPKQPGREKSERIHQRDQIIRELAKQHSISGQWARLAELANSDERIMALNLPEVTRHVARNAVKGMRRGRGAN